MIFMYTFKFCELLCLEKWKNRLTEIHTNMTRCCCCWFLLFLLILHLVLLYFSCSSCFFFFTSFADDGTKVPAVVNQWVKVAHFHHDLRILWSIQAVTKSTVFYKCPILTSIRIFSSYFRSPVIMVPRSPTTMKMTSTLFIDLNVFISNC